jgi:hypothetical protein
MRRDDANEFKNTAKELNPSINFFSPAFSGKRPKGETVGNWLLLNPDYTTPPPTSVDDNFKIFGEAVAKCIEDRDKDEVNAGRIALSGRFMYLQEKQIQIAYNRALKYLEEEHSVSIFPTAPVLGGIDDCVYDKSALMNTDDVTSMTEEEENESGQTPSLL